MQEWELRHPAGLSSGECSLGRGGVVLLGDPVLASALQFERGSRGLSLGCGAGFWDLRSQARPQEGSRLPLRSRFIVGLDGDRAEKGKVAEGVGV